MSLWRRIYGERRRVLLPLAVAVVVNIGVLVLAVLPLARNVASTEDAAVQASIDLANARLLERQAKDATASKARAEQELSKFYGEALPRDFPSASRTANRWLQDAARESGLEFKGSHFDWDEVRDSRLSRAYATVNLAGRYADVRRFLHAVETANEFMVVEKVALNQAEAVAGNTNGPLEVVLTVATYFVTPEAPRP